ncbi:unnamed protein product (macronuclear) [Paramecium tetraurelia]|uniref:Uncharacterized protein n=1 Tax=Paramecium tetraurelia TaxID=5888 RepID=A0EG65_PARTE|nr:uncharacterized protein GSPATT00026630001 [Paramecium tetraurelia]CAK94306.1 unnamed protein product [Paramecium tetraurelia]|eukprot:XP_001461679.1 hypothetical protein (macronuclear) [Paramecium tetraurelia strain d4-2]
MLHKIRDEKIVKQLVSNKKDIIRKILACLLHSTSMLKYFQMAQHYFLKRPSPEAQILHFWSYFKVNENKLITLNAHGSFISSVLSIFQKPVYEGTHQFLNNFGFEVRFTIHLRVTLNKRNNLETSIKVLQIESTPVVNCNFQNQKHVRNREDFDSYQWNDVLIHYQIQDKQLEQQQGI